MDSEPTDYNTQADEVDETVTQVPFDEEEGGEEWVVLGAPIRAFPAHPDRSHLGC